MESVKKWLNTPFGSLVKVFISILFAEYMLLNKMGIDMFNMDMTTFKALLSASLSAFFPILINAWNSADHRYGFGKEKEAEDAEAN